MTCSLPHVENERRWSVNHCWPCIKVNHSVKWSLLSIYVVLTGFIRPKAQEHLVVALEIKSIVTVQEEVVEISHTY